ncbi:hypothetical protein EDD86DRAFT_203317 [Gorgonomyces haynaldii]|nr:hypothetical protein EDD86DRAFT_203317 [Gorgonomyces haynaldii]
MKSSKCEAVVFAKDGIPMTKCVKKRDLDSPRPRTSSFDGVFFFLWCIVPVVADTTTFACRQEWEAICHWAAFEIEKSLVCRIGFTRTVAHAHVCPPVDVIIRAVAVSRERKGRCGDLLAVDVDPGLERRIILGEDTRFVIVDVEACTRREIPAVDDTSTHWSLDLTVDTSKRSIRRIVGSLGWKSKYEEHDRGSHDAFL